jgi:hypothetical protein
MAHGSKLMADIHIERRAHVQKMKNRNFEIFFHFPQVVAEQYLTSFPDV